MKIIIKYGEEEKEFDLTQMDERQRWLIKTFLEIQRKNTMMDFYKLENAHDTDILGKWLEDVRILNEKIERCINFEATNA